MKMILKFEKKYALKFSEKQTNHIICAFIRKWLTSRGGARGGLGDYSPVGAYWSPVGRGKAILSEIFGIYSTLKTIF